MTDSLPPPPPGMEGARSSRREDSGSDLSSGDKAKEGAGPPKRQFRRGRWTPTPQVRRRLRKWGFEIGRIAAILLVAGGLLYGAYAYFGKSWELPWGLFQSEETEKSPRPVQEDKGSPTSAPEDKDASDAKKNPKEKKDKKDRKNRQGE